MANGGGGGGVAGGIPMEEVARSEKSVGRLVPFWREHPFSLVLGKPPPTSCYFHFACMNLLGFLLAAYRNPQQLICRFPVSLHRNVGEKDVSYSRS